MLIVLVASGISACSAVDKFKGALSDRGNVDYQNNRSIKALEVPPDLTTPQFDKSFELPSTGVVSAVSLKNGGTGVVQNTVSSSGVSGSGIPRTKVLSMVRTLGDQAVLQVNDSYPRSVILTEIMLTRMNFTILNKSLADGILNVRYNGNDVPLSGRSSGLLAKTKGLLGLSESNNALSKGQTYRVSVQNQKDFPIVRFASVSAKPLSVGAHTRIINLLNAEFNR